eukprot:514256_1
MLYRKIYKISLGAYVLLSSLTHGSTYYVQSAPSSNYQCPSGEALCHIYCDQAEHTNHNTYDCNDAQHCYFHCDAKLCGEWSEINAANAIHLNVTQASSGQQCLQFANVTTPDHGNAYLSSYAKKGFWGMNLFAGTNANQIIIDVSDEKNDKKVDLQEMNIYAGTATYFNFNLGNLEWKASILECPANSAYNGPDIAPCTIDASNGKLNEILIKAPYGIPRGFWINDCKTCTNVQIQCTQADALNGIVQGNTSFYPFNSTSDCWWTNHPTTDPTNAPSVSPTNAPSFAPSFAPSVSPTRATQSPSAVPSNAPTLSPSFSPSNSPSYPPSATPTKATITPSAHPPTSAVVDRGRAASTGDIDPVLIILVGIIAVVSVMIIALLQWFKRSLRIKKRSETICGGEVTATQQQTQPETEEPKPIPKGKRNKVVLQSTLQLTDTVMVDGDSDSDDLYMPGKEVEVETIGGDVAPKREKESDVIVIKVNHDGRGGEVDAVRSWMLETVRLPQYTDLLLRCGFDTLERCSEVTIEDLRGLGVVIGHARKIIKYTKQLREQFVE